MPHTEDQESSFAAAYGEAIFYAHLIEDVLAVHLLKCSHFRFGGYSLSAAAIRGMKHEKRIDELLKIHEHQKGDPVESLVDALHLLREIRTIVTHAFIPQLGSDLETEEGLDQVLAMLRETSDFQRRWLRMLKEFHHGLMREVGNKKPDKALLREDPPFDPNLARLHIQQRLQSLRDLAAA